MAGSFGLIPHWSKDTKIARHTYNARVETVLFGDREKDTIVYDGIGHGVGATTDKIVWGTVHTRGAKLVENGDQAISRDAELYGMMEADKRNLPIILHVHDEVGAEVEDDPFSPGLEDLVECLSTSPSWGPDLPLAAEGFTSKVYRKG
jgi:DNA polymerase